jgi:hypothetical protein
MRACWYNLNYLSKDERNIIYSKLDRYDWIIAKYAHGRTDIQLNNEFCEYAAENGYLELLQWARANATPPAPWNEWVCIYAALNGHLELLQWARVNGAPWDEWVCRYAANNGYIEILKWARSMEPPAPWDEWVRTYAARKGHLELLQWARANGAPE